MVFRRAGDTLYGNHTKQVTAISRGMLSLSIKVDGTFSKHCGLNEKNIIVVTSGMVTSSSTDVNVSANGV
jgi:hypothetical protein